MKTLARLSLICVLILAGCKTAPATAPSTMQGTTGSKPAAAEGKMMANAVSASWDLATTEDANATPHTKLSLVLKGAVNQTIDLGTFTGSSGGAPEVKNAALTQTLWFAGGGDQFAVFLGEDSNENAEIQVSHRAVDEEQTGDQPWKIVKHIAVPKGTTLHAARVGAME